MASIYLSSTVKDLAAHRARVIAALRRAGHEPIAMEDYAARDERPLAASRADVARCDVYVGLVAWRYGFRPAEDNPEALSITELEFREAVAKQKPRLVFVLDETTPWQRDLDDSVNGEGDRGDCIQRFRAQLVSERWAGHFSSAEELATDVIAAVTRHLAESGPPPAAARRGWSGSPYPGLVTLTAEHALIFFGRDLETGELLERMTAGRLLVVVGASGAGKSSLVAAGLLPQLAAGALAGSGDWRVEDFTPATHGAESLRALAAALCRRGGDTEQTYEHLRGSSHDVDAVVEAALAGRPPGAELLLFADQLEEVFRCKDEAAFLTRLVELSRHPRARVVATVRADLFHRCLGHALFGEALRAAAWPLGVPSPDALRVMVREPARLVGVELDTGLTERIAADTLGDGGGAEPGALALMAYTLAELWRRRAPGRPPTLAAYEDDLGGVGGAIGRRAEQVFHTLDDEAQSAFPRLFRELVDVDEHRGVPTRRRTPAAGLAADGAASRLVDALAAPDTRLLVRAEARGERVSEAAGEPVVEVAHEALLRSWPRLAEWIGDHVGHLQRVREAERAAHGWQAHPDSAEFAPWGHERQVLVYESLAKLGRALDDEPEPLRGFLRPEAERLLSELDDPLVQPLRRAAIGERPSASG